MIIKIQILAMVWGAYGYQLISRIGECGLSCSQGFLCKTQTSTNIINSFCHHAPASLSNGTLRSMKLWTAMKCVDGRQCTLHLSIKGTLQFDENIHGMEICSLSVETQKSQCVHIKFSRHPHVKLAGKKQVKVQFNCFEVNVGQRLHVTMRTIPNYCSVKLSQEYYVEDCRNSDVGKNIPVCFAGKLAYDLDPARKTISVNMSDVVQDTNYYVRLCHQRFVCEDVGSVSMIQGKDLANSIALQYTRLLPCLCIQAWPAIPDARRIQLCPFKNDTSALWDNIVYNSITQTLTWEAACPVDVTVSLCQLMDTSNHLCVDLHNSSNTVSEKATYSRVDTLPNLCMKFTTKHGSWIRCPFAHGQAWKMKVAIMEEQLKVFFTPYAEAQFSVLVCNKTEPSSCDSAGILRSNSVSNSIPAAVNISEKTCGPNICIQGKRTDVDYSIPIHICDISCTVSTWSQEHYEHSLNILSLVALLAILVTMMALLGHKSLSVFHRKTHKGKNTSQIKADRMKSIYSWHL